MPFSPGLIELIKTSSRMLNRSGESGHLLIVPDLRGKAFSISTLLFSYRSHGEPCDL